MRSPGSSPDKAGNYDAITKSLIDRHPKDWLRLVGFTEADAVEPFDVKLVDSDLATISAASDRVLKVAGPPETLYHVEMESGHHGADKPYDLLAYSALLSRKYRLPVETSVILLRREADSPALTGALDSSRKDGSLYLHFEYNIVRVWQIPVLSLLRGGIGTLPLAPIANVNPTDLPQVIERMNERIEAEGGSGKAELWTATKILMGLRYSTTLADNLLKGVRAMKESVTYQAILEEGEALGRAKGEAKGELEGERKVLLRVGERRLGTASEAVIAKIAAIDSAERLLELAERLLSVESWDELLPADE